MRVDRITFYSDLRDVGNIFDDNIDVGVTLEDGLTYIVVVGTAKNLLTLMNNEQSDFLSPGDPIIIVRKMTKEVIEKAIQAYAEGDAYYLKFYAASLDTRTLDVLNERSMARSKLLIDLIEKNEPSDIDDYNLIDFNLDNHKKS